MFRRLGDASSVQWMLFAEGPTELIETTLLSPSIGRRRVGGILLQGSMHALVTTVLLGLPVFIRSGFTRALINAPRAS